VNFLTGAEIAVCLPTAKIDWTELGLIETDGGQNDQRLRDLLDNREQGSDWLIKAQSDVIREQVLAAFGSLRQACRGAQP
jgi:hypothetical protein